MRQDLVDVHGTVVGRAFVRRSGEVHLVWDAGDRLVCCWGAGPGGEDVFRLWTYRAEENRHECYDGAEARRVAQRFWACTEYTEGGKSAQLPVYLSHEWWERWRDDSDSERARSPSRSRPRGQAYPHPHLPPHPYRRPRRSPSASSASARSDDSLHPHSHRPHAFLDPHVNERIRRLESALVWHSNILERIVNCRHHDCAHVDERADDGCRRGALTVKALLDSSADGEEELGSRLRSLEGRSGDIDQRLKHVQLCGDCA